MANERSWDSIGPVAFIADGGQDGVVTVASVHGMRVKQQVIVSSLTKPSNLKEVKLEIKKVLSPTKIIVGPIKTTGEFMSREDLSTYTVADMATIKVIDQKKSQPKPEDILKAAYEQEPVVAIRTFGVDELGRPWNNDNPLPVEGTIVLSSNDPTIQSVQNITMAVANQEYSVTLPNGARRYQIRIREHLAKGRLAFSPNETNTNWWTLTRGTVVDSYIMNLPINSTIYVSSDKPNMTLEIITWIKA